MRIRDDSDLETVLLGVAYRQADAVHANGAFLHGHIPLPGHLLIKSVLERIVPAAVRLLHLRTNGGLVHVPLYDMPVQTAVHQHATLQVHLIAHFQVPEVRTFQGLLDSGNRIRIFRHAYHRKANAVVSHALIYFQLIHE